MKLINIVTLLLLGSVAVAGSAQEAKQGRTFQQIGLGLTRGNDTGWEQPGYGGTFRSFTFLDSASPDGGFYYGFGASFTHAGGGDVSIGDARLVTVGWMGDPWAVLGAPGVPFELDVGLSPTLGSRIRGSTILGSLYTGVGLILGAHFAFADDQSVGLSWEPVIPVTSWGGAPAPNLGYSDFVISWTSKLRTETRTLPWRD